MYSDPTILLNLLLKYDFYLCIHHILAYGLYYNKNKIIKNEFKPEFIDILSDFKNKYIYILGIECIYIEYNLCYYLK